MKKNHFVNNDTALIKKINPIFKLIKKFLKMLFYLKNYKINPAITVCMQFMMTN